MNLNDILRFEIFKNAKVIAGLKGLNNTVTGVNIIEALDISTWGRKGIVLLSSYFAFLDKDISLVQDFFKKAAELEISAIIFKKKRVISKVPNEIVKICNELSIPVIEVENDIKYEDIIINIITPLLNQNELLLKEYYQMHQEMTELLLSQLDLDSIILRLEKFIGNKITLVNNNSNSDKLRASKNSKYISQEQYETICKCNSTLNLKGQNIYDLHINIYNVENYSYSLIIRDILKEEINRKTLIIENTIRVLQTYILKNQNHRYQKFINENTYMQELFEGRLSKEEVKQYLLNKNIKNGPYMILSVKTDGKDPSNLISKIYDSFNQLTGDFCYYKGLNDIYFLAQDKYKQIIKKKFPKNLPCYFAINTAKSYDKISIAKKINDKIIEFEKLSNIRSKIIDYSDLGILKIIIESKKSFDIKQIITPLSQDLIENHPHLYETAYTFIMNHKNYQKTAKDLFLHEKTVRYRITKLQNQYNFDFNDMNFNISFVISAQIMKLIS